MKILLEPSAVMPWHERNTDHNLPSELDPTQACLKAPENVMKPMEKFPVTGLLQTLIEVLLGLFCTLGCLHGIIHRLVYMVKSVLHVRSCLAVQAAGESNKPQPRQLLSIRDCLFTSQNNQYID